MKLIFQLFNIFIRPQNFRNMHKSFFFSFFISRHFCRCDLAVFGMRWVGRLWSEEFSGERNDVRFKHFVVLAGSVLPVWQKARVLYNDHVMFAITSSTLDVK